MIFAVRLEKITKESPVEPMSDPQFLRLNPGDEAILSYDWSDGSRSYVVRESDLTKIMKARATLKGLELFLRLGGHQEEANEVASIFEALE